MKHIIKNKEPHSFSIWKALARDNDYKITYDELPSDDIKKDLKTSLLVEQGYICCYCECRLEDDYSHIEHFMPRCYINVDSLDYSNMLCSCQRDLRKEEKIEPDHCGISKGGWFDAQLLISPLNISCENHFTYTGDGGIDASTASDIAAKETIKRLKLDLPELRDLRKNAIAPFLDTNLEDKDFFLFVTGYLEKRPDGKFERFWSTINCMFGKINNTIEICPVQVISTKDTKF